MSEEQNKIDRPNTILFGDDAYQIGYSDGKLDGKLEALKELSLTVDQREKVIRLCDDLSHISPNWDSYHEQYVCPFCFEFISFKKTDHRELKMDQMKHAPSCIFIHAKQLLEELQG